MIKKLLYILGLLQAGYSSAQQCPGPLLVAPLNGAVNVPVDTDIRWNGITGVPAYLFSLGTTPFGTDILNRQNVGNTTSYIPPNTPDQLNPNTIKIYDRYGRLIARVDPSSEGWDGTFKGQPVPSDDYWFRAELEEQGDLRGHFALKR